MSIFDEILAMIPGRKPKDTATPEERIEELKKQAEEAEKLASQTKEALELKKRIAAANTDRQRYLLQSGGSAKKSYLMTQKIVVGVMVIVFIVIIFKSCGL